jgi:Tfp pilus assembly protein PilW
MSPRPHNAFRSPATPRLRRGLGLVEVLLCVAIGAMLLTAVAVAFRASFNSYKDSQQRGQMLNSARSLMSRITADIRMSDAVHDATHSLPAPYDITTSVWTSESNQWLAGNVPGNPTAGLPTAGGSGIQGIQLIKTHADSWDPLASTASPVVITYWFDNTSKQVFMTRQLGAGVPSTPLVVCSFVQTFQIYMEPVYESPNTTVSFNGGFVLQRAVINMTLANKDVNGARILSDGGQDLTLTFSDAATPRRLYPGQSTPPF